MSDTQKVIEIEVLRYLPESDAAPHSEIYKVIIFLARSKGPGGFF